MSAHQPLSAQYSTTFGNVPVGAQLPPSPMVARNQVHAQLDTALEDGDEVAVLPPLAGG